MYSEKFYRKYCEKLLNKYTPGLLESIEKVYPGKWDINIEEFEKEYIENFYSRSRNKNKQLFISSATELAIPVIIYYPEIEISNSKSKHNIKDLYVKIKIYLFGSNNDRIYEYKTLTGARGSLSYAELHNGYRHSHLNSLNYLKFSEFCTGSGPIRHIRPNDKNDWEFYLYTLDNFVRWESISGVPYIYIDNLRSIANQNISESNIDSTYKLLLKEDTFKHLKFKINKFGIDCILTEEFEKLAGQVLINRSLVSLLSIKGTDGDYYAYTETEEYNTYLPNAVGKKIFKFKGEDIHLKVIQNEAIKNTGKEEVYPNPKITKGVLKKLSEELTFQEIRRNSIEKENTTTNTTRNNTKNKTLV